MAKNTSFVLNEELERYVAECVAGGGYQNASELMREALREHQARAARIAELRALIAKGAASGTAPAGVEERVLSRIRALKAAKIG